MTGIQEDHSEEAAQRLTDAVSARRHRLGLKQEQLATLGGPSSRTVRDIEAGRLTSFTQSMLGKLDRSLKWEDGTAERILDGIATPEELAQIVERKTGGAAAAGSGVGASLLDRMAERRYGPRERIPQQTPTIVTVTELLNRLAAEEKRTPTMGEAVDVLSRLLPELWVAEDKRGEDDAMRWQPPDDRG